MTPGEQAALLQRAIEGGAFLDEVLAWWRLAPPSRGNLGSEGAAPLLEAIDAFLGERVSVFALQLVTSTLVSGSRRAAFADAIRLRAPKVGRP